MPYLAYEEPGIVLILTLTSFLVLLNGTRYILDQLLYCGLIGEILIGIIWGMPIGGTTWLSNGTQEAIQAFGYLGLIGLVFEGGLGTDLVLLRKSAGMSISVATVGLLMPIAMSFLLLVFPFPSSTGTLFPSPLAGFSAGASLCSTSLGTTLEILSSANMHKTRVGVVLLGAAMMDDVVGLVMVNIVTTLGNGGSAGWPIARPIVASFGMLLVTLFIAPFILKPLWTAIRGHAQHDTNMSSPPSSKCNLQRSAVKAVHAIPHISFLLSTTVLIIYVTIASFINASVLFASFIAGGIVNYLWGIGTDEQPELVVVNSPGKMFEEYYKPAMEYVLVPFFFASIGFSIPITNMFAVSILWKGIIYAILMMVAKGLVALVIYSDYFMKILWHKKFSIRRRSSNRSQSSENQQRQPHTEEVSASAPHSAALLVSFAMVARGEIGFLIVSLSQSSGTLTLRHSDGSEGKPGGEDVFLVIVWAVVICTIIGPIGVGILVRSLKRRDVEGGSSAWL